MNFIAMALGFLANKAIAFGKSIAEDILLGVANVFILASAIFTLVGVIGFYSTAENVKYLLPSLSFENDAPAVGSIIDSILRNTHFMRFGMFFILLFSLCAMILSFARGRNPLFPIFCVIVGGVGFGFNFCLSVYCSVREMLEIGLNVLIRPEGIREAVAINVIMWMAIGQIILVILGGALFSED